MIDFIESIARVRPASLAQD